MIDPGLAKAIAALNNEVIRLQGQVKTLQQAQTRGQLGQSSIDDGFLTVVSGGTVRQIIGMQPDGTVTSIDHNGPAPPIPSTPTVTSAPAGLTIAWDGTFSGGTAQPMDFADVEVHVSTSSGFTPSSATMRAVLLKAGQITVQPLSFGTTYYVVLVAANTSSVKSAVSTQVSAVPSTVLISPVTASAIGYIGVLNANPYFTGGDVTGWAERAGSGTVSVVNTQPSGSPYTYALKLISDSSGLGEAWEPGPPAFPVVFGSQYMVTGLFYTPGTSVSLGLSFLLAGSWVSDVVNTFTVTPNTWTQLTAVVTAPSSGVDSAGPVFSTPGQVSTYTMYGQAVTALPQVPGGLIQTGTVTATQIAAGVVVAGIINGTTVDTATLEVASSGTGNGIFVYNGVPNFGNLIISMTGQAGTDAYGNVYTAGITVAPSFGFIDGSNIPDGTLAGTALANDAITAVQIADQAVTTQQLANAAVGAGQLAAGAVYPGAIQTGAVTTNSIAANAIVAGLIAAGAVDALNINTGTLTVQGGQGQILVYNGVAAVGTLFVSIAGQAGVDAFGNSFPAGIAITNNGTIIGADLIIQPSQGALIGYSQ
ncbi:MAG TPA: hypothetical protein VEO01_16770 [Pseudonocardiaceae bacterium]|nr:hypothetical protein [Pseudonocardiaceae bacterium]